VVSYISFNGVAKTFATKSGRDIEALRDVSFEVGRNEFVTIVGPSGCGKSTLLRLAAGLTPPTVGDVLVDGAPVREPQRDVGMVFQHSVLLQWKDALGNVLLPARILGLERDAATARARALLEMVGLSEFGHRFPRELSGGMRQRVAICRALLAQPSILLMDEPFGALDALTREELSLELMRIWSEEVKTVLFVTHSIPEAVLLGDRVIVMGRRPGTVVAVADIELDRPRDIGLTATPVFQEYVASIRSRITKDRAVGEGRGLD
jgi:NitT/TauT family transport system ATP-binding protein